MLWPSAIAVALLGLYSKRGYQGPGAAWVHDSLGGVFYVILWCLVVAIFLPRWTARRIAIAVVIATCILEFLQAWHPPLLELARSNFLGRSLLGSFFDWADFPYYFIGGVLGWCWLRAAGRA